MSIVLQTNGPNGDCMINGNLSCQTFTPPKNCIGNSAVATGQQITQDKIEHVPLYQVSQTGTIVNATYYFGPKKTATQDQLYVLAQITEAIATGADRTVTIDVQKSHAGGAFTTILTATLQFTNLSSLLQPGQLSGVFAANEQTVTGDVIKITVTVAGAAGAQAQGLAICMGARADPV